MSVCAKSFGKFLPSAGVYSDRQIPFGVKNSVRSHYERKDFERLFGLQSRAAQHLMQTVFPSARVGRSFLVERASLETFLEALAESDDPQAYLAARRSAQPASVPRRSIRQFLPADRVPCDARDVAGQYRYQAWSAFNYFR